MQTVYLVMAREDGGLSYRGESRIVAVYLDRGAAELHVEHAAREAERIRQTVRGLLDQTAGVWRDGMKEFEKSPASRSAWDRQFDLHDWVNETTYAVIESAVFSHPDQWQDAPADVRQPE